MKTIDLPMEQLCEAPWNANAMEPATLQRLKNSIARYGLVENLVVRPINLKKYEVLSGNQRLQVLTDLGWERVPCAVVDLPDAEAKLLGQTLNSLHGFDDLGIRAKLLEEILAAIPEGEVLSSLSETASSLQALGFVSQDDLAQHLQNWQLAQRAKLRTFSVRLTQEQSRVVDAAIKKYLPQASRVQNRSPNLRGTALHLICEEIMNQEESS